MQLYDTDLNPLTAFPLGQELHGQIQDLVIASDGASAFVTVNRDENEATVLRVRLADGETLAQRHLAEHGVPPSLTLVAKGRRILMASFRPENQSREGHLIVFDSDSLGVVTQLPICAGRPTGIAVLSDIERAYVRCTNSDALVEVDLKLGRLVQMTALPPPGCGDGQLAAVRTGSRLYMPCATSGQLIYLDRRTLAPIDSVRIGTGIRSVHVDRRGEFALVSRPSESELVLVDLGARQVHRRSPIPGPIKGLTIQAGDGWIFAAASHTAPFSELLSLIVPELRTVAAARLAGEAMSLDIWPRGQTPVLNWLK